MRDINWLLSAVAQSTAALVAIVGGLVVSRLISLAGERSGLERQIASLTHARDQAKREVDDIRARLVEYWAGRSVEAWIERLLGDEEVTHQWLYEEMEDNGGWSLDDYVPHLDALKSALTAARKAVGALYASGSLAQIDDDDLPRTADDVEQFGVPLPRHEFSRRMWNEVAERARKAELAKRRDARRQADRQLGLSSIFTMPSPVRPDFDFASQFSVADLSGPSGADYDKRLAEVNALDKELQVLRDALADVKSPKRLWAGFWVLAVFAVVGTIYPMGLMATGPTSWSGWLAGSVVVLFGAGLIALLVYIALLLGDLKREPGEDP